jgi:rare lipoprotein A
MFKPARFYVLLTLCSLAACASVSPPATNPGSLAPGVATATAPAPAASPVRPSTTTPPLPPAASGRGGYYKDDGPHEAPPPDLDKVPDAVPRAEPLHRFANRPYTVLGRSYTPRTSWEPFVQTGRASWYGRRFHGNRTSSGEIYDMHAMTAAHPTLPIPSYVRVTHLGNGRSLVVRVNDRGPFHAERIIDLSYAAAFRLDYLRDGSAEVRVELLTPDDIAAGRVGTTAPAAAANPATVPPSVLNTPSVVMTAPSSGRSVFVQLGAFSSENNALALRDRLARELGPVADKLQLVPGSGDLLRLQLGPLNDRQEAQQLARQIADLLGVSGLLVLER